MEKPRGHVDRRALAGALRDLADRVERGVTEIAPEALDALLQQVSAIVDAETTASVRAQLAHGALDGKNDT